MQFAVYAPLTTLCRTLCAALGAALLAVGCGAQLGSRLQESLVEIAPLAPVFALEIRKSSYGISLRDPANLTGRLGQRFEQACAERNASFLGGNLEVASNLTHWRQNEPNQRLVIAATGSGTFTSDGTLVGRTEQGGSGPWTPVLVGIVCRD